MEKSNYALYIEEREGKQIIEDAYGFATYLFTGQHCYIEDIFVKKAHRASGHAAKYADQITAIALEKGYKKLLGSVNLNAKNSTTSMKVLMAYGFKLLSVEPGQMIYLEKELEN